MNSTTTPTEFSVRQTTALHALASGFSVTEAAEASGVHRSQLYRWLDNPKYNNALLNAKREHFVAIGYRFHTLAHKALDTLEQILTDEKASPHARIRAAKLVFEKMQVHQPLSQTSWEELVQTDQQCKDANAPHIVVGRFPYDPDACDLSNGQPQSPSEASATECDTKSELAKAATASATECDAKTKVPRQGESKAIYPATECDAPEALSASTLCNTPIELAELQLPGAQRDNRL